ncbi:MAG: carbon-nitrogen hydrolase family protein [Pseudomonadota bacterium]
MRIATAQPRIDRSPARNADQIKAMIGEAVRGGADFIHFPEGALSGYVKAQIKDWSDVDWPALEGALQDIQACCAAHRIGAAIGCAHKHPERGRPFNSLYVIGDTGELSARYDKRFCSHSEITDWFSAGTSPVLLEVKGIKLGFALCIEIQFPEIFMEYEKLGADCVLFSAYQDGEMFKIQAQGHAACNTYWISYSVPANTSHVQASCFIGPDGSLVATCEKEQAGLILNEVDPEEARWDIPCKKARPWRKLARQGDIYKAHQPTEG